MDIQIPKPIFLILIINNLKTIGLFNYDPIFVFNNHRMNTAKFDHNNLFESFTKTIQDIVDISDKDILKVISVLKVRHIKKKKNILNEGDICNNIFYVKEGLFRYYLIDESKEHTIDIISEQNWFGDIKAFISRENAEISIEALEDSTIFVLNHNDLLRFYDEIPLFDRLVRKIMEHYFIKAFERIKKVSRSSYTAQVRYKEFFKTHPKLINRVPAVYLASYLGVTPETLSRLRNAK